MTPPFGSSFTGHPFLLLCLALLAAPLLIRQLQYNQFQRTWWLIPLAGLLLGGAAQLENLLFKVPADSWLDLLRFQASLILGLLALVVLNRVFRGRDRELIELMATVPGLLFLKDFAGRWFTLEHPLAPLFSVFAGGLAALVLVFLVTGAQEKFRINRAPGSMEGLPFRLAVVMLCLLLILGMEALFAGRLP